MYDLLHFIKFLTKGCDSQRFEIQCLDRNFLLTLNKYTAQLADFADVAPKYRLINTTKICANHVFKNNRLTKEEKNYETK